MLCFPNGVLVAVFCRSLSVQQLIKYREQKDGIFASKSCSLSPANFECEQLVHILFVLHVLFIDEVEGEEKGKMSTKITGTISC